MTRAAAVRSDTPPPPQRGRVVRLPRRAGQRPKASPDALAGLLAALDIRLISTTEYRSDNCTAAGNVLRRMLAVHGPEHLTIVLRTIVESEGNARALTDPIIQAISAVVLAHPDWAETGLRWIEAFDNFPLRDCYDGAKRLKKTAAAPGWAYLAGMIALVMRDAFDGDRKRPRSRVERAEARQDRKAAARAQRIEAFARTNGTRIDLGLQLIELKRTAGHQQFKRQAVRRFNVNDYDLAPLMRVAAAYANRPEIWRCVPWVVLIELAAPMSDELRAEFERRIEAGERVTAKEIAARRRCGRAATTK